MTTKQTNIEKYSLWKASRTDKAIITIFFLFLSYIILMPSYYQRNTSIPSKDKIYNTTGILSYGGSNKLGYHPIITDKKRKKTSFSCRFSYGARHICLMDKGNLKELLGKNSEIGWFWQKTSPFSYQKRVLYLNVEGKTIIRSERTEEAINKAKKSWKFDTSKYLILILISCFACRFILKKNHEYQIRLKKEQQEKNDNE